jgi:hypothetical protein
MRRIAIKSVYQANGIARTAITAALTSLVALILTGALAPSAHAQSATWNYEAPVFMEMDETPILNRAPNLGSLSILASFTSSGSSFFRIGPASAPVNNLFSGQYLITGSTTDSLIITFSAPVTQFSTDYALNVVTGAPSGSMTAVTNNAETFSSSSSDAGPANTPQGGTLSFTASTPFTSVTLTARNASAATVQFGVDNTSVGEGVSATAPEPGSLALLALTGLPLGTLVIRRRRMTTPR